MTNTPFKMKGWSPFKQEETEDEKLLKKLIKKHGSKEALEEHISKGFLSTYGKGKSKKLFTEEGKFIK